MRARETDIAIVGGGLAGGLIALALARVRPDIRLCLIESGAVPGGNHRWSWFSSDVSPAGAELLAQMHTAHWDAGYDVAFPSHSRTLATPYNSLTSADFAAALERELQQGAVLAGRQAALVEQGGVTLEGGERITARAVVDCRGFAPSPHLRGGWQVFLGRHLRLAAPHNLTRPIIMDASLEQHDGYRFVYVLPLGPHEIFVEDTYYNNGPVLDQAALSARLDTYCRAHGWQGVELGSETGVLPVITGGDFPAFQAQQRIAGVAAAGVRGGFTHPLTSYTLPFAVETALAIAANADLTGAQLAAMLEARARQHWRSTRFYRLLGAMLFGAALPAERYRVFERFYRLPEALIERFYTARSTRTDMARILCGRPPVPIGRALTAIGKAQPTLEEAA